MRHGKRFNHLSRTSAHRKAMLANMASSLIMHKRITTTVAKAKALRTYIEPLITKSKADSTHSRRVVFSYLNDKEAVTELFREVSVKVADRPGGYTRIIKIGPRLGDNAEMALIELVDYNENLLGTKSATAKKSRRRRGTAKKQETESAVAEKAVETADEEVVADEVKDEAIAEPEEKAIEEAAEKTPAEAADNAPEEIKPETPQEEIAEEPAPTGEKKEVPEAEEKAAEEEKKDKE